MSKNNIKVMRDIAEKRSGLCLSDEYINLTTKLKWRCVDGHEWWSPSETIKKGSWCPTCSTALRNLKHSVHSNLINEFSLTDYAGKSEIHRLLFEKVKEKITEKGGVCLSEKYMGGGPYDKYEVQCSNGHIFSSPYRAILKGHWCSYCRGFYIEDFCRQILEWLLKEKFPKARPLWLNNYENGGGRMELDGYSEKLQIAFEYQGEQHYKPIRFSLSYDAEKVLANIQARDRLKKDLCELHGVKLIVIPTKNSSAGIEELTETIKSLLNESGVQYQPNQEMVSIKRRVSTKLDDLKNALLLSNRILLEKAFLGDKVPHKYWCKIGQHEWQISPGGLAKGQGCGHIDCLGTKRRKYGLADAQNHAKKKGGELLSSEYSVSKKLMWKCEKNHAWSALFSNVRNLGRWCPACAKEKAAIRNIGKKKLRHGLVDAQNYARKKGGELLSSEYSVNQKLMWKCEKNHTWSALFSNLRDHRSWCRLCTNERLSIRFKKTGVKEKDLNLVAA